MGSLRLRNDQRTSGTQLWIPVQSFKVTAYYSGIHAKIFYPVITTMDLEPMMIWIGAWGTSEPTNGFMYSYMYDLVDLRSTFKCKYIRMCSSHSFAVVVFLSITVYWELKTLFASSCTIWVKHFTTHAYLSQATFFMKSTAWSLTRHVGFKNTEIFSTIRVTECT